MPGSVKLRLVPPVLLAALVALVVAGCGGGSSSGGTDPATVAPAKTPFYVEFTIRPEGETKANIEALAKEIAGIDDLGSLVVSKLEESALDEGEELDYEKEVEPWLGEKAAFIYPEYSEGDFQGFALALQTTDAGAAEEFIENQAKKDNESVESGSFEGVDFKVEEDGNTVGVVGDLVVVAKEESIFKEVVTASNGESLADEDTFTSTVANVPDKSAADVYFDIGGLIRASEAEGKVDQSTKLFFENAGLNLDEATIAASLIPGSDNVEIDISTNAGGSSASSSGDASKLLGSLPESSVAAFASAEFGKHFEEAIDQLDENGFPGEVPPHELKKALKEKGIDIESITSSLGDAGLFLTGNSRSSLGAAAVFTTEDATQAKNTVSNIGLILRSSGLPGVTAIKGAGSGFSIRSEGLGRNPLVVIAKGSKIAIGYGRVSALAAVQESGETLSESPAYQEAVSALGSTPISGFVDGHAALRLASALIPPSEEGFREAKKYLTKIDYIAIGAESSGDVATVKLIAGVGK
jgi:sporulation protein YlmC with PRC-barrel domain